MAGLLLLTVLAASVLMPTFASREGSPARGLRKLVVQMLVFSIFYWLVVMLATPAV